MAKGARPKYNTQKFGEAQTPYKRCGESMYSEA
jgi:hypothetical protein